MAKIMPKDELGEVGRWKDKALAAKGGIVNHPFRNDGTILKNCGHPMGGGCKCPYQPIKKMRKI